MATEHIRSTQGGVATLLSALQTALGDVTAARQAVGMTTSNMAGSWQGAASTAFQDNIATWERGADKVASALEELYGGVTKAGQTMADTETTARSVAANAGSGAGSWATNG
jgi:WXG100 family type VII secretion target